MALKKCRECGHDVSTNAKLCPHCGAPVKIKMPWVSLIILFLVILYFIGKCTGPQENVQNTNNVKKQTTEQTTLSNSTIKYASRNTNVRSGPSVDYSVTWQLLKGEEVTITKRDGNWVQIKSGTNNGWVYEPNLEMVSPIKQSPSSASKPDFEVVNWNWYKDQDFGGDGSVIWTVEVRNNTVSYKKLIKVEFSSYDANGNIITTDDSYVESLSPGEKGSTKGYADYFGSEKTARVRIVE